MKKLLVLLISTSFYACTSAANLSTSQTQNNINQTDLSRLDRADYIVGTNVESQIVWIKAVLCFSSLELTGGMNNSEEKRCI